MSRAFEWVTQETETFLKSGYLSENEDVQQRVRDIADHAEEILGIEGFSDKFFDYMSRGWISLSSPVWSNYGKKRGLPVSCFSTYVKDDVGGIMYSQSEVGMQSKVGGGTSGYFGAVRPRGSSINDNGKTSGSVHFMELFEKVADVISQGSTRRGRFSPYLPIEHGDIDEFLDIGTEGHPIQNLTTAVTVSDDFMNSIIEGNSENRKTWAKLLKIRSEIGFPYIMFSDNANRNKPDVYQDKNMEILNSQLCSEILLPQNENESFVCVLSSVNLLKYDEWKNTDLVETMVYFLDTVCSEFINRMEEYKNSSENDDQTMFYFMKRTYEFTKKHRALGLGVLGWHSLLQSKMIPFESSEASALNKEVHQTIQEKSQKGSEELASMFGEPELLKGYGRRNTTLNAIAPTTSSAFILGQVSQSIEPLMSNFYIKDLAKLKAVVKNKYLENLLEDKGKNTEEVWDSIASRDGSVQHLSFLSETEKAVFKTFREIDPKVIISQAAERQEFLDQTQSLNLMIDNSYKPKDINALVIDAWRKGICTLYYQHSVNAAREFARDVDQSDCVACEA